MVRAGKQPLFPPSPRTPNGARRETAAPSHPRELRIGPRRERELLEAPGEPGALTEFWATAFAAGAMDPETRELRALEAEVAALQRECSMLSKPWEKTSGARKSFQKFPQSDSEGWKSWRDLKSQLAHLKSEVSFLSKLTGINIRNYSKTEDITNNEVTEKDTKKILQRHRLSGNCSMVTFQLEFQVLEIEIFLIVNTSCAVVVHGFDPSTQETEYPSCSSFVEDASQDLQ
ncbi:centromere protein P-like protein [Cricetulus griseus]|nr:centromere protein P-like protein [Cricetulus griseus]